MSQKCDEEIDEKDDITEVEKESPEVFLRREKKRRFKENFYKIFENCPVEVGKSLSKKERRQNNLLKDTALIYGEVTFDGFTKILDRLAELNSGSVKGTFVDLGSGTGKACVMAALSDQFSSVIGMEVLEKLHAKAKENKARYQRMIVPTPSTEVMFSRDDFIAADEWTQIATCVFTLCSCFCDELMDDLIKKLDTCEKGTYVVSVTHPIISDKYKLLEHGKYEMSFGKATVFFHQKVIS